MNKSNFNVDIVDGNFDQKLFFDEELLLLKKIKNFMK